LLQQQQQQQQSVEFDTGDANAYGFHQQKPAHLDVSSGDAAAHDKNIHFSSNSIAPGAATANGSGGAHVLLQQLLESHMSVSNTPKEQIASAASAAVPVPVDGPEHAEAIWFLAHYHHSIGAPQSLIAFFASR
jgi:hypothetical protein